MANSSTTRKNPDVLVGAPIPLAVLEETAPRLIPRLLRGMRLYAAFAAAISILAGAIGLLGWLVNNDSLKSVLPGHVTVKANTAICFVLLGLALFLRFRPRRGFQRVARCCAAIAAGVGALSLVEYLFRVNLHFDELLFREPPGAYATYSPGRMAAATAINLLLIGTAILLPDGHSTRRRYLPDVLALAAGLISLLAVVGYMYGVSLFYTLTYYTQMSFPAAIAFSFLSTGVCCARGQSGISRYLVSEGTGGIMLRRFLPLALVVPQIMGWIVSGGRRAALYDSQMEILLFALSLTVLFTVVVFWNARSLDRTHEARSRAENVLRRSRDQWELTFNCMTEGLSYHDLEYNIVGANDAFRNMLGRESLAGVKCYEAVHATSCPPGYCPMRRTLETGKTEASEFFEPRLGRYLSVRTDPVIDNEGKVVRIVHVVADITEKREAEAAIRRLAAIVESSEDAIIAADLEGHVTSWNRAAERMYGYSAVEAQGCSLELLCPPEHTGEAVGSIERIRNGETLVSYDTERVRKDGTRVSVSITVSPIYDGDGSVCGASAIARDISDRKRAEERERQSRREIEAKSTEIAKLNADLEERVRLRTLELEVANRELESFSYSVSHDLRAPLRSIDGFSHILLDEYSDKLDAEGQQFLGRVLMASQQMGQLIDALLSLSRVARSEMRRDSVDMSALAVEVAENLKQLSPERRVEFRIAPDIRVSGDARLLQVVLQNLIGNAFKFTSRRDFAVIEFGSVQQHGAPVYFVRDNGAGFQMEFAHKLFGAFQRLHAVSEFEGSGIGLATVQRIIRRHGGRVWAEARPEEGATFYFTLP